MLKKIKIISFNDYFSCHEEYADPTEVDINSSGWEITYISHTFLNGWINYVKPISAFVIPRYSKDGEEYYKLKENVEKFNRQKDIHSQLNLGDDVLILARDKRMDWWFFWFDCDVSDCSIGRFITKDTDQEVIQLFKDYVVDRMEDLCEGYKEKREAMELNVENICGWIRF